MSGKGEETPQDFYLPLRHRCALVAGAVLTNAATVAMIVFGVMNGRQEQIEVGIAMTVIALLFCGVWLPPLFPYRLYSDRLERWELFRKVSIPLDGAVIRTKIGANGESFFSVIHGKKELWIRECDPWRKPLCALLRDRVPAEPKPDETLESSWGVYRATELRRFGSLAAVGVSGFFGLFFLALEDRAPDATVWRLGITAFYFIVFVVMLRLWWRSRGQVELTPTHLRLLNARSKLLQELPLTTDTAVSWSKSKELTISNTTGKITVPLSIAGQHRLRKGIEGILLANAGAVTASDVRVALPITAKPPLWAIILGAAMGLFGAGFAAFMLISPLVTILQAVFFTFLGVASPLFVGAMMLMRTRIDVGGVELRCIAPLWRIPRAEIMAVELSEADEPDGSHATLIIQPKNGRNMAIVDTILPVPAWALHRALNKLWFESEDA